MTSAMDLKRLYHDNNIDSRVSEQRHASTSSEDEARMPNEYTPSIEPLQIQVSSTFDADMILRKIIEDRSAILALRSEADRNEKELLKAKVWQMQTSEQLSNAEREISRQVAKARYDIAEYNESSRQYISGFVEAFQHGEIEKLRHHPFLPSFKDLEEAIARRKALVIEKVQADDRVRKLEIISSRHHIAKAVLKKNEEAFVRAIAIAKQQFQDSCGSWLNQFEQILSALPDQGISGKKDKVSVRVSNGYVAHEHENNQAKRSKCSSKRPSTVLHQSDTKSKRHKSDSSPVADLRHDDTSPKTNNASVGVTTPENNGNRHDVSQANSDFMNDMVIAEALTKLGG